VGKDITVIGIRVLIVLVSNACIMARAGSHCSDDYSRITSYFRTGEEYLISNRGFLAGPSSLKDVKRNV